MIPGMNKMKQFKKMMPDDRELIKIEAIINSMTPRERRKYTIINASRRRRIARGSGSTIQDVNRLMKQFEDTRKMMRMMTTGGRKKMARMMGNMPFGR